MVVEVDTGLPMENAVVHHADFAALPQKGWLLASRFIEIDKEQSVILISLRSDLFTVGS